MQHTAGVVVGDHRQVLMPTFVRDLIDTDVEHVLELVAVEMISDHPDHDALHGFPRDAQQPTDAGLVGALREPTNQVFQIAGQSRPGTCPRHLFGADPPTGPTAHPPDLSLEPQPTRTEIEVPPAATGMVIAGGLASARTSMCSCPWLDRDDDTVAGELDSVNSRSSNTENAIECSADVHVCDASLARCLGRLRT